VAEAPAAPAAEPVAEFRMPSLGADMDAGTLVRWHVQPGTRVQRGDIVAVVETDKGAIEVEIFRSGVVERLLVPEGVKVPVGTPLALLSAGGPAAADGAAPGVAGGTAAGGPPAHPAPPGPPATTAAAAPAGAPPAAGRVRASPLARRLAEELGVDLGTVRGTGPGGAIERADVERAAGGPVPTGAPAPAAPGPPRPPAAPPGPGAPRVPGGPVAQPPRPQEPQAAMRRAIAAVMARSKREIPHYYLAMDIDLQRALAWLQTENLQRPVTARLLPAALLLKAVALAVREVPEMNGHYVDGAFRRSEAVHLGVAIALRGGGLVAPAIHDAETLTPDALMAALRDLVGRARRGGLRSSEVADPTLTVTSLGEQSATAVFGVIYAPQVALVGFGTIAERPWAVDGLLGVRPVVSASLSADHRVSDGHRGGRFLAAIARRLQEPEHL
jgi:pyruvate dehydrogenase E2 component (dihydrolipoamide acetyltransferase)